MRGLLRACLVRAVTRCRAARSEAPARGVPRPRPDGSPRARTARHSGRVCAAVKDVPPAPFSHTHWLDSAQGCRPGRRHSPMSLQLSCGARVHQAALKQGLSPAPQQQAARPLRGVYFHAAFKLCTCSCSRWTMVSGSSLQLLARTPAAKLVSCNSAHTPQHTVILHKCI